eukprot:5010621-Amphidinium_carterae.1
MAKREQCMVCGRHVRCERCSFCCGSVCPKCAQVIQRRYGLVDISCHWCEEYESVSRAHGFDDDVVGEESGQILRASKGCRAE